MADLENSTPDLEVNPLPPCFHLRMHYNLTTNEVFCSSCGVRFVPQPAFDTVRAERDALSRELDGWIQRATNESKRADTTATAQPTPTPAPDIEGDLNELRYALLFKREGGELDRAAAAQTVEAARKEIERLRAQVAGLVRALNTYPYTLQSLSSRLLEIETGGLTDNQAFALGFVVGFLRRLDALQLDAAATEATE